MSSKSLSYLTEMGIECWSLNHPERLEGAPAEPVSLPENCSLLLVSPVKPEGEMAVMFEKILKSIKLTLADARHVYPAQVSQVEGGEVKWFWFAGCDATESRFPSAKKLISPQLSELDGNIEHKRALWQQIRSYES